MARDISISINAKDNFSDAIGKMQTIQTGFRNDLVKLNKELDTMNRNKIELKVDMTKAKSEVKEAEKAFIKLGDEASRNKLIMAQTNFDNTKRNLDLLSSGAKKAERDVRNLADTMNKGKGKGKGSFNGAGAGPKDNKSFMSALNGSGLLNMIGTSLAGGAGSIASSAFGSKTGNGVKSILGGAAAGAAAGAAMGTATIPVLGTMSGAVVGAVVGTISGAVDAMSQAFTEKDDAFKSVVKSNYDMVKESERNSLSAGSVTSANQEKDKISFSTMLGGDDKATAFLGDISNFSSKTPFEYDQVTAMSKKLLGSGYKQEEIIPLLTKIGDSGSALGLSPDDINVVATTMGGMKTTDKTSLDHLEPLMERGIPALDYLAESLGVAKDKVVEMLSEGLVSGEKSAQVISEAMGNNFQGNMDKESQTFGGMQSNLQELNSQMDTAMGEGFNEKRKEGMSNQIEFLSGENGEKMKEANKQIGEWKASLENERELLIRDSIESTMDDKDYLKAEKEGDSVTMGRLLMEARIRGENEFKATDGYVLQVEADKALIKQIRDDTGLKEEYWDTGYTMGLEFDKGLAAVRNKYPLGPTEKMNNSFSANSPNGSMNKLYNENHNESEKAYKEAQKNKKSFGMNYVPYDNFPALLHQGEKVLTASQARNNDISNGPFTVNIGNVAIREEADIGRIANEFLAKLNKARMNYGG